MAWIRRRTRSDGLVSLAVRWRDPRGKLQSETFREADAAAANEFLRLVEGSGGDWPPRWIKGEGLPANVSSVTVRDAALSWVASNTRGTRILEHPLGGLLQLGGHAINLRASVPCEGLQLGGIGTGE